MNSNFIELIENSLRHKDSLELIEQEIKLLFKFISKTNHINDANLLFKNLEDIQFILAKAVFKDELSVSSFLRDFIYDFDRIDDPDVKQNLYQRIKTGSSCK